MKGMTMMDYKELFDNVMYEKYDTTPLSDDNAFIQGIKERASNMEKKKIRSKKPAVIAASIAAAAALTVSAGAALNWDIASLFESSNEKAREQPQPWFQREFRESYKTENFTNRGVSAETEYDILQALSHEIDREFYVNGRKVHILGYAYDGFRLDVLYDETFDDNIELTEDTVPYTTLPILVLSDETDYSGNWEIGYSEIIGNTVRYRAKFKVKIDGEKSSARLIFADESENLKAHRLGMEYKTENYADIELERDNPYSYRSNPNIRIDGSYTVTDLSISPFGISIEGKTVEQVNSFRFPVIVVFSDGSAADLYTSGTSAGCQTFSSQYPSGGILLDAREITELRIDDVTIPINKK